jgi:hypothetical protein
MRSGGVCRLGVSGRSSHQLAMSSARGAEAAEPQLARRTIARLFDRTDPAVLYPSLRIMNQISPQISEPNNPALQSRQSVRDAINISRLIDLGCFDRTIDFRVLASAELAFADEFVDGSSEAGCCRLRAR